jgi:hypothetical protein
MSYAATRVSGVLAIGVAVPVAAVNEDRDSASPEDKIGSSGKVATVGLE